MRGLKDGEKDISPMFPRLHVNDTEKGGPRAPPRNKMALYEQLSIPSQRSTPGSPSKLPRQQNNSSSLVSSVSSGQASAYPSTFTPFCNSNAPSYLAEGGIKLNTTVADDEQKSTQPTNYQRSDSDATGPLSTAKSTSSQTFSYSNVKNLSFKIPGNENNVRVSTSGQGKIPYYTNSQSKESKKLSHLSLSSTLHHKSPGENLKSRHLVRNYSEENPRRSRISQDSPGGFASVQVERERDFEGASSFPTTAVKNSERSKQGLASLNQENNSSRDILRKLHDTKTQPHEEFIAMSDKVALKDDLVESVRSPLREISSKVRLTSESSSRELFADDGRNPDRLENGTKFHEQENCGSPAGRRDGVLEISMVDAISALNVRPDDVVGLIGEKQFWKARRTITCQQRIFAVQVFELHRLIKVQRSIAGSPHVLHEDSLYLHKPTTQASPVKKTQEYVVEPPASVVKPKTCAQKPNLNTEFAEEDAVRKLPLPSVNNNSRKGPSSKQSSYDEYLRNPPPAPTTMTKSVAWPFHSSPGNQWLVPVMSPSEGLVYKPFAGPCPPTPGFAVPNCGSCGPMSLNPGSTCGGPACNQQGIGILPGAPPVGGQTYFPPPYGLPVMNPFVSNSAVEQMAPFGVGLSNEPEYESSFEEVNFTKPHQGSCNISSQMSRAMSCRGEAFQASKGSELQRSTASSSSERGRRDALPLFPMAPTVEEPDQSTQTSKHQTQVIKVVPHNPRSATESAARIFRSIQEERKHLRLVSS